MNYTEEEAFHYMELDHEAIEQTGCTHAHTSGDRRWPILCGKDSRFCKAEYCAENCTDKQRLCDVCGEPTSGGAVRCAPCVKISEKILALEGR
jgi:hypothetical protein